jgi:N-acetyl-alpha-D-muramate 1-phosphate uridylyltransferase
MTLPTLALLAGGLATRMRPLTATTPKSLIEVAGEPFIIHQLRLFRRQGLQRIVICIGWLGDQIAAEIGDGARFGLSIVYSSDGDRLRGTGGALQRALPHLGEEFLVCYGDSYLDVPYPPVVDRFHAAGLPGLMTVYRNDDRWGRSNVEYDDGVIRCYDKRTRTPNMRHIDYGLAMLRRGVFEHWRDAAPFDLAEVYQGLVATRQMAGFEVDRRFYEIGSAEGKADTEAYLRGDGA